MSKFAYLLILLLILGDIFLFVVSSDIRIFGILILYAFFIKTLKLKSNVTFALSLILLIFAYVQFIFSDPVVFITPGEPVAEKTAVWVFLFLVIGIIQKWRE